MYDEILDFMTKAKISKSNKTSETKELKELIGATVKLWRKYHPTYYQADYVAKEVRRNLSIKRIKTHKKVSRFNNSRQETVFDAISKICGRIRRLFKQNALNKVFDGQSVRSVAEELRINESLIHTAVGNEPL